MPQRHTILVTGCHGQVGWELRRTLAPLGEVIAIDRPNLDLCQPQSIREYVRSLKPSIIVNPAAYTAVDGAESEVDTCRALNAQAPTVLAEEARRLRALFIHYSTDYVFDGSGQTPRVETDPVAPLGVYGLTKAEGERGVLEAGGSALVFRLSWVYASRGMNFLLRILQLAQEREELRIVDDQHGAPTWARAVAEATAAVVAQGLGDPYAFGVERRGLYHMAAGGRTTWFRFAESFLRRDAGRAPQRLRNLVPIASADYPTPAQRPHFSVLSCEKLERVFGLRLPDWEEQLELVMAEIEASKAR